MRTLITGITGMIGSHFANATRSKGWSTFGLARNSASSRLAAVPEENVFRCDILDRDALDEVVAKVKPDLVIHMAAQAFNGISWQAEETTHHANYLGTMAVLRSCRKTVPKAKIILACSSAAYGDVKPEDCPLVEDRLLKPITPYGVSKAATECLGYQYFANYKMDVYLPRLFIHVGTGHPPATAIQNFARQLALIAKGVLPPVMKVGALTTARDFIDVRDGVEGMMLMLERGAPGQPMNICTGTAFKISDILRMLVEISGLKVEVTSDPSLLRPSDEPLLLGDNTKLKALGWRQRYSMKQTLEAVYADWLGRV
ncbi:MAG: GDP-mannose 4,6-dehydratase [Bdellovibrionota bacterium]